jgi:hypothetical protein
MSITLNYTTIDSADSKGTWSTVGDGEGLADSDYPPKEGSQCVQFEVKAGKNHAGIKSQTVSGFDIRTYEAGLWFLNPQVNNAGDTLISNTNSGVILRLYSGSNWADYYQVQHRDENGNWNGGWMYLRASGAPGSEDANSGTWGTSQVSSVDSVAVLVASNGDNTGKNDAAYGVDWAKYYNKIIVTGYKTGSTPWTLDDIIDTDADKDSGGGVWGISEQYDTFFKIYAGIEFGDGSNNGKLVSKNQTLYLYQSSSAQDYDILVKNHFILEFGTKDTGSDSVYAKEGVRIEVTDTPAFQLSSPVKPSPDFKVESGGIFNAYATIISGFNDVDFGSGGSSSMEFIKCDFYKNNLLKFNSTNLGLYKSKIHSVLNNENDAGNVSVNISAVEDIDVFLVDNGLKFSTDYTVYRYKASDTTKDLIVSDTHTVNLIDCEINPSKLGVS